MPRVNAPVPSASVAASTRARPATCPPTCPASRPASWTVYLLRCVDGTLYAGITNDLPRRLRAHAAGDAKYTRGRLPVELVYSEPAADRSAALRREAALKRLRRAQKEALIAEAEPGIHGTKVRSAPSPKKRG